MIMRWGLFFLRSKMLYLSQIKRSTAWNRAFEELRHHQHLLQKLGKIKEEFNDIEDTDGPTPAKVRNQESSSSKAASNMPKQLIKDLRVKVERLSSDGHVEMQATNDTIDNKEDVTKNNTENEERPVPHLPVAEDEPAREITSTCPQGLKKEGSQEDMVTSSSQEPRSKCVLVQTEQIQTDGLPPAKVSFSLLSSSFFFRIRVCAHYPRLPSYENFRLKGNVELRSNRRQRRWRNYAVNWN